MRAAVRGKEGLIYKRSYSQLNVPFYKKKKKSRAEDSMHPSRRMSFNVAFFCGKAPQAEALRLLGEDLGKKLVLPALLHCLALSYHSPLPLGGCLAELRQCAVCLNPASQGKPRVSLHISFSGSFTNGLSHWQSCRFCCWIFAMPFDWNHNSACVLESCLLFVLREGMWQDAEVGRSCVMSH